MYKDKIFYIKDDKDEECIKCILDLEKKLDTTMTEIRPRTFFFKKRKEGKSYLVIFHSGKKLEKLRRINELIGSKYQSMYSSNYIIYGIENTKKSILSFEQSYRDYYKLYKNINKHEKDRIVSNIIDNIILLEKLMLLDSTTEEGEIEKNIADLCIIFRAQRDEIETAVGFFKTKAISIDIHKIKKYITTRIEEINNSKLKEQKDKNEITYNISEDRFIYAISDKERLYKFLTDYDIEIYFSS